jgi:hypothetical protein
MYSGSEWDYAKTDSQVCEILKCLNLLHAMIINKMKNRHLEIAVRQN